MLREITSIEEMAALKSGTYVLNKFCLTGEQLERDYVPAENQ